MFCFTKDQTTVSFFLCCQSCVLCCVGDIQETSTKTFAMWVAHLYLCLYFPPVYYTITPLPKTAVVIKSVVDKYNVSGPATCVTKVFVKTTMPCAVGIILNHTWRYPLQNLICTSLISGYLTLQAEALLVLHDTALSSEYFVLHI